MREEEEIVMSLAHRWCRASTCKDELVVINSMIFCILLSGKPRKTSWHPMKNSDSWERPWTLGKTRAGVRRLGKLKHIVRENEPINDCYGKLYYKISTGIG